MKSFLVKIFILILLIPFAGCSYVCCDITPDDLCKPIHINDGWYENGPEGDDTRVLSYRLDGDCLFLKVGYGGGCKEHDIQLAARGWIKTEPPQLEAKIVHDDQDHCEAYIQEEAGFDLGSVGDENEFYINLKGFEQQIYVKRN